MSYQELKNFLSFEKAIPVIDKFSAAPDVLKAISEYCLEIAGGYRRVQQQY
ncbi:MAG: hypothetical protein KAT61_11135 [Gammaproteobacteria bacterium]|nr:hypothetical protein [Gammaproteobacteria bacterium]